MKRMADYPEPDLTWRDLVWIVLAGFLAVFVVWLLVCAGVLAFG